jgi:hypothetical protein
MSEAFFPLSASDAKWAGSVGSCAGAGAGGQDRKRLNQKRNAIGNFSAKGPSWARTIRRVPKVITVKAPTLV